MRECPVRVSKTVARKVRDLTLGGTLDWVVEDGSRDDPSGQPRATLSWRYPSEVAAPVGAYQDELEFEIQSKEISGGNRATFTGQATRYGPGHRPLRRGHLQP